MAAAQENIMSHSSHYIAGAPPPVSWNPALRPDRSPQQEKLEFTFESSVPTQESTSAPESVFPAGAPESSNPVNSETASSPEPVSSDLPQTQDESVDSLPVAIESAPSIPVHQEAHLGFAQESSAHAAMLTENSAEQPGQGQQDANEPVGAIDEFKWDDGDEFAPSSETTQPFSDLLQRPDVMDRTNSFPDVDVSRNITDGQVYAPDDVTEAPPTEHAIPHPEQPADVNMHNGTEGEKATLPWSGSGEDEEDGFFNQLRTQTKPIYTPLEAESRFEEGVPLMDNSESFASEGHRQTVSIDAIFAADEAEDDTGFFSSPPTTSKGPGPQSLPALHRKSTDQVLTSLLVDQDSQGLQSTIAPEPSASSDNTQAQPSVTEGPVTEEDLAERWAAELGDDDLLVDDEDLEPSFEVSEQTPQNGHAVVGTPDYTPQYQQSATAQQFHAGPHGMATAKPQVNPYTPHQPSSSDLVQGLPAPGYMQGTFVAPTGASLPTQQTPADQSQKPESFVNQPKAGYKSPYDLPEDIARPKRAPIHRSSTHPAPRMQPPPRSSSMSGTQPTSSGSFAPPPVPSQMATTTSPPPASKPSTASSNFFEELPVTSRSRPSTRGRYTPQPASAQSSVPSHGLFAPPQVAAPPSAQRSNDQFAQFQLQTPGRIDPYAGLSAPATSSGPPQTSPYSPKPGSLQPGSKPPPSLRYSPAPPPSTGPPAPNRYVSQPPSVPHASGVLPFQPRTSSPLAQREIDVTQAFAPGPALQTASVPTEPQPVPQTQLQITSQPNDQRSHPPALNHYPLPASSESDAGHPIPGYAPQQLSPPRNAYQRAAQSNMLISRSAPDAQFMPPKRSQTQSPGKMFHEPTFPAFGGEPFQRPASVHDPQSPTTSHPPLSSIHGRAVSQQLDFIAPTDGQEYDPLQRWRGAPVFKFGFGGTIASSFPKHVPRYMTGNPIPKIKASAGEVRVQRMSNIVSFPEPIVKFPGPLKNKSKKKEVIAWLSAMIASFENQSLSLSQLSSASLKQHEENILLWKVVRILVEHDGILEGTAEIQKEVHNTLCPVPSSEFAAHGFSAPTSSTRTIQPEPVSPEGMESVRHSLLEGNREKAVWSAVDLRLWGHAMLISSTLDKSVWKQVIQEFIRREVRSAGDNTQSLAALYEIFAGNLEESIDELVPASARAGLQMVSKTAGGPTRNALDGLDKWQETLGLILSNRSQSDHQALLALARLLASYGRIEASHICTLFAKSSSTPNIFGGVDDSQAMVMLLGVDHRRYPYTFTTDLNHILLTEVLEFATTVLAGSGSTPMPYLQAFKLQHAMSLAEEGHTSEAQQYCESIGAVLKATTRPSPYFNSRFLVELDDLTLRLRQAPSDGTSSWISKPSMEKVSGSMWAKFNSFVAGDDSDGASTGSAKIGDDVGPFAKVVGTPPISRSPSVAESYGPYFAAGNQPVPVPAAGSRYAPGNQYAPNASPDQSRGRTSLDSQRSPSFSASGRSLPQRRSSQDPTTPLDSHYQPAGHSIYSPPAHGRHSTPPQSSYTPLAPVDENCSPQTMAPAAGPANGLAISGPYAGQQAPQPMHGAPPLNNGLAQPSGYEPPSMSMGYEPPSYEPPSYEPEPSNEEAVEDEKPKKKSFMDDDEDDDLVARMSKVKVSDQPREVDDAVRRAAEEDAKRPPPGSEKKGWFTGWFGGKKENPAGGGPIRAKLGEENSFYYDKDLKRWVNKKDPNSANVTAHSTPPPPKRSAPPSRSASAGMGPPPLGPPDLLSANSAPMLPPTSALANSPLRADGTPSPSLSPSLLGPPSASPGLIPRSVSAGNMAPPSRPGTSLSNASSIDDLLGAPQARKPSTVKARKKGRGYIDLMAK
ncbi:hypothetical protein AJ80_06579 [Polytolypa hystricis UAMH7299]|uniref:Protein transport protein sec16 n=1 Tax=Polytolypa hystricis (strain UAMH7299) TaxID=1447883 RepID=A0A2B7XUY0_POLH7|nr:hypothetical protein AJ80_06579 [Polytolypa hystricis UAMH7299]